ncbi:MAG: hypothetical protein ACOZAL_01185 [Patescibacteria group bacterium]
MSDRFLLKAICSECGSDLNKGDEYGQRFMLAVGDSIDLTCPECGIVWRFWMDIGHRQKKIGQKRVIKNK